VKELKCGHNRYVSVMVVEGFMPSMP